MPLRPNSEVVVLPRSTAPASRKRATEGASSSQRPAASTVREPERVGQPRVSSRSLIDTGTPSSGPSGASRNQRSSDACAADNARSASTKTNALKRGSSCSMRASTRRVTSTGDS
jgi:hypothetical protein